MNEQTKLSIDGELAIQKGKMGLGTTDQQALQQLIDHAKAAKSHETFTTIPASILGQELKKLDRYQQYASEVFPGTHFTF